MNKWKTQTIEPKKEELFSRVVPEPRWSFAMPKVPIRRRSKWRVDSSR